MKRKVGAGVCVNGVSTGGCRWRAPAIRTLPAQEGVWGGLRGAAQHHQLSCEGDALHPTANLPLLFVSAYVTVDIPCLCLRLLLPISI